MVEAAARLRYRFQAFELAPVDRRLWRDGVAVPLAPRAFNVLVVLVERAGSLVTKDDLLALVWPGAIVEETTVQVQVSMLRKVLGKDAIRTVSRHGYRFDWSVSAEAAEQPAPGVAARRVNLPHALTRFIGREREAAEVSRLLTGTRLVTLVGVGGCGKTRLALHVAEASMAGHPDGVWLVELAPLFDPALVPTAVAAVLGIRDVQGKTTTEGITTHLAGRRMLIVLDNAEHLRDAVSELATAVLSRCAETSLLVTSRERLGINGETGYRVPTLSMPGADDVTPERLESVESARLFIDRAQALRPDFAVTAANAPSLAALCRRLDGLPLAIELAATRVRSMSVEDIARRVDQRFALLTGGPRTAAQRQRTLRSMVDWSYDLLPDNEKLLLCRLSVFSGGWTLEAADKVCADAHGAPFATGDLLNSLVGKSLVSAAEEKGVTRFGMLQTIRDYARSWLVEHGDEAAWRHRHLDHFLSFASAAYEQHGSPEAQTLARMQAEQDNLRSALAWAADSGRARDELRLAVAQTRFWWWRGQWHEGLAALSRALEGDPAAHEPRDRMLATGTAGILAAFLGQFARARAIHGEGLAFARRHDDPTFLAWALGDLGTTEYAQGGYEAAADCFREALALFRQTGDAPRAAEMVTSLGNAAFELGDFAEARRHFEDGLRLRSASKQWGDAATLGILATMDYYEGRLLDARARCEESLALYRTVSDPRGTAMCAGQLGALTCELGDVPKGLTMLNDSLQVLSTLGDRRGTIGMIVWLAETFARLDQVPTAARLWGAAEGIRDANGIRQSPRAAQRVQAQAAAARASHADEAGFEQAWTVGRAMDLPRAVEHAKRACATLLGALVCAE